MNDPKAGSDIVLRGLTLLAIMVIVVVGGFAILFSRVAQPIPSVSVQPERLASLVAQPLAEYPAALSWGTLYQFADELPSQPGWRIRYQVARNFANRGSDKVDWVVYREMLDEPRQFRNFRLRLDDGRVVTEEAAARQIIIGALKDLATWHTKQPARTTPGAEQLAVYTAVDRLATSDILELRTQAEKTRATFFR